MLDLLEIFVSLIFIYPLTLCLLKIKFYKSKLKNKICSNCCPVYTKTLDSLK